MRSIDLTKDTQVKINFDFSVNKVKCFLGYFLEFNSKEDKKAIIDIYRPESSDEIIFYTTKWLIKKDFEGDKVSIDFSGN